MGGWVAARKSICLTLPETGVAVGLLGISRTSPHTMAITATRPTARENVWRSDSRHAGRWNVGRWNVGRWNVGRWNAGKAIFGGCQVDDRRRFRGWAPGLGSGAGAGCARTPCGRLRRLAAEGAEDGSTRSGCARRSVGAWLETFFEAAASVGSCLSRPGLTRGSLMSWCLPLPFRHPDSGRWRLPPGDVAERVGLPPLAGEPGEETVVEVCTIPPIRAWRTCSPA